MTTRNYNLESIDPHSYLLRAEMQANVLYVHDENKRLVRINEDDPEGPAPRFFLSRTPGGNLWRTRYDLPPDLIEALERTAYQEPIRDDLTAPPTYLSDYIKLLEQHAPIEEQDAGPSYMLFDRTVPDEAVRITTENADLLEAYFPYTMSHFALHEPVVAIVADGKAVAICRTVRELPHWAEAGVDTVPDYRGRGYAVLATQGWSAYTYKAGRLPLYSTSWDNMASQAVARKLGAEQYATTLSIY